MRQTAGLFIGFISVLYGVTTGCSEEVDGEDCEKSNTAPARDLSESPCGKLVYQSLDWEEPTVLGIRAKDVFKPVQGTCTTTLSWDATGIAGAANPSSGESVVSVTLVLNPSTVEIGRYEFPNAGSECASDSITIKGNATVTSADGVFNDSGEVLLIYRETKGLSYLKLEKSIAALGGTFSISGADRDATILSYDFVTPGVACVGEIVLTGSESQGEGMAAASEGAIGTWTNTGCPFGEDPIDLTKKGSDGLTTLDRINDIFSGETYRAKWEDGTETNLNIQSSVLSIPACTGQPTPDTPTINVDIPVSVIYGTSDDKLASRSMEAQLLVSMAKNGAIQTASLFVSDNLSCEDEGDSLSYGFGDCTALSGITVQLGLTWETAFGWNLSDEGVMIYEYPSGIAPFIGAAERVRVLSVF
jgi:hypothetical protein